MEPSTLFHVAAHALPAGQILRPYAVASEYPGLVGRAVQALGAGPAAMHRLLASDEWSRLIHHGNHHPEMILLEAAFERARLNTAPSLPNRLDAVYTWSSLALARRFRAKFRPTGIIHCCSLTNGTTLERDGALVVEAFEAANLSQPSERDFQQVEERATRYWQALQPMALPELLIHGTVVIEATVDIDGDGTT